ncbi:receptor-type tyrosine-protein phosphatase f [Plakobranchus ocellatus]|uniref:Receptor-type tyrosine-protein phosphatase f n=1 Tax=Plakobranchus ocellatus TaxID=259542 RepID=A0AAV3ZTM1_9GAST|nr:receptor-type tyrosine-protein phosphatase f [Plakobranchus ocellatus]
MCLGPCVGSALPRAPVGLQGSGVTASSVTLRWMPDTASLEPATSYVVQYRIEPDEEGGRRGRVMEKAGIVRPSYTVTNLKPFTRYSFQVLGVNSVGRSRPSRVITVTTGEIG